MDRIKNVTQSSVICWFISSGGFFWSVRKETLQKMRVLNFDKCVCRCRPHVKTWTREVDIRDH